MFESSESESFPHYRSDADMYMDQRLQRILFWARARRVAESVLEVLTPLGYANPAFTPNLYVAVDEETNQGLL